MGCLSVVLVFCTHGVTIGRTKILREAGGEGKRGQLAELIVMLLEWAWVEGGSRLRSAAVAADASSTQRALLALLARG